MTTAKAFTGILQAKALDENGKEIGCAQKDVSLDAGGASYMDFQFPEQMDSALLRTIHLSVKTLGERLDAQHQRHPVHPQPATG